MKHYTPYTNAWNQVKVVKQGFSWPAFFTHALGLSWIWAFYKKCWLLGFGIIGYYLLMGNMQTDYYAYHGYYSTELSLVSIGITIFFGFIANRFVEHKLTNKGYERGRPIEAPSQEAAQGVAFRRMQASSPA